MIWKILGSIGAASFIFTGLQVLSDPTCITADIGGGRVVGVTCRADEFGAFSGGTTGFIMLLIGAVLFTLIFWQNLQRLLGKEKPSSFSQINNKLPIEHNKRTTSIKKCDKCGKLLEARWGHCPACLGTTFTYEQRELKPYEDRPQDVVENANAILDGKTENSNPEFKICPMCAEQIRFAAKKCRYCSSLI